MPSVAGAKEAGGFGRAVFVGDDVTRGVEVNEVGDKGVVGDAADGNEKAVDREGELVLPCWGVVGREGERGEFLVAVEGNESGRREDFEVGEGADFVNEDGVGAEIGAARDEIDFFR